MNSVYETFARVDARIKMAKIHLNFVDKLVNSSLFPAFTALFRQIFSHLSFSTYPCGRRILRFAPHSCKGLN